MVDYQRVGAECVRSAPFLQIWLLSGKQLALLMIPAYGNQPTPLNDGEKSHMVATSTSHPGPAVHLWCAISSRSDELIKK